MGLGKGAALLMISAVVMAAANYVIHIGVARLLGPALYGIFGTLMSLYLINRSLINTAIPRAVSYFIASFPEKSRSIIKKSVKFQLICAIIFSITLMLSSKFISQILKDPSLQIYIIILGLIVVPLSMYALFLSGFLNGLREFKKQAITRTLFSIIRAVLTLALVYIGLKIYGVLLGYLITIVICLFMAYRAVKKSKLVKQIKGDFFVADIGRLGGQFAIAALGFSLIRNVSVLFVKSMMQDNVLVGLFTAAVVLSNVTYNVFLGLPMALFPSISAAIAKKSKGLAQKYTQQSLRYMMILIFPVAAVIASTSSQILTLLYSPEYISAGPVLSLLIVASTLFIIFKTQNTILTAAGKPTLEMTFVIGFAVLLAIFNVLLIPSMGLQGAALASIITSVIGVICTSFCVYRTIGCLMRLKSFLAILSSAIIIYFVGIFMTEYWIIAIYLIQLPVYTILLYLSGELRKNDIETLKKALFNKTYK
jgi:O-antigen/teichoic acid export membrane protein